MGSYWADLIEIAAAPGHTLLGKPFAPFVGDTRALTRCVVHMPGLYCWRPFEKE